MIMRNPLNLNWRNRMTIVGTILLTADRQYVIDEGRLPVRGNWDKELLTTLAKGNTVSQKGYEMLPPSIQDVVHITSGEPTFPVTIPEIDSLSDLLIVSHSYEISTVGKEFDLDRSFELLTVGKKTSLWKRKGN